tara:strand:- start:3678 stop:3935 length:258 start_codon:yes stop_codon:yes gene_type:complete
MNLDTVSEYDLIGQKIIISSSTNKQLVGISGNAILETKNMIILNTKNGKKNIPKNICKFSNDKGIIEIDETKFTKKVYERLEITA